MIQTDICMIGAGPVGLFAVFEAGLLKMRCHLVDVLPHIGGQLTEMYPQKPIYDIPGSPAIKAETLIDRLSEQIAPFNPGFTLGERVDQISGKAGDFFVRTSDHTEIQCKVIVIAGGLGCFEPRKPAIENLEIYEGKGVSFMVKNPEYFRDRKVVIAGGGDAALDWTIFLSDFASELSLIHRGNTFRGTPDSSAKVFELAKHGKINLILQAHITGLNGTGHVQEITYTDKDNSEQTLKTDHLITLFGLSPKLGPIAEWGLDIERSAIVVNMKDYQTNIEGIYAIGDINTYPGKLKLILSGFHEGALMAQSAFRFVFPEERLHFQYTTVHGVNPF